MGLCPLPNLGISGGSQTNGMNMGDIGVGIAQQTDQLRAEVVVQKQLQARTTVRSFWAAYCKQARTSWTVMRVPFMHGLPERTSGRISIRDSQKIAGEHRIPLPIVGLFSLERMD